MHHPPLRSVSILFPRSWPGDRISDAVAILDNAVEAWGSPGVLSFTVGHTDAPCVDCLPSGAESAIAGMLEEVGK